MGRRQNRRRPPDNQGLQHRNRVVAEADNQGAVPRALARRDGGVPAAEPGGRNRYLVLAVCGFLLLAVGLVFSQTIRHEFVNLDDSGYVYENNPQVARGLTGQGIAWAFTHSHIGNWHPLTWISLMLDCQVYGLNAGGYHLTNVLLHAATAVLLFLVLQRMTGRLWLSALATALFVIHPLRVESVAWVTERKDVLSGLFFMLTLAAYVGYVHHRFSLVRYLTVMVFFALGLMSKPMLVTLPFVLLLLDYWPLNRMAFAAREDAPILDSRRPGRFSLFLHLLSEKAPLLLLAVVSCVLTIWSQDKALVLIEHLPLSWRIGNALLSYVVYLGQFFYPVALAVLYPRLGLDLPPGRIFGAFLVLVAITAAALLGRRRCPYLLMGWLWYVGMLVPVIGLVQVGMAAMADRFTYLTQIGLCIALAWGAADVCRSWPHRRWVCGITSALVLAILMGCAWRQTSFWRTSETLWTHALACTSRNSVAHWGIGHTLVGRGRVAEAIVHFQKSLEIDPHWSETHNNLGSALASQGQLEEAIAHFRTALEIQPGNAVVYGNLGNALASRGRFAEAITYYRQALEIKPDDAEAHNNLGNALANRGQFDEAMAHYQKAMEIKPGDAKAHNTLGVALAGHGRLDAALSHYRQALEIDPNLAEAHNNLGFVLARLGRLREAMICYRQALKIRPDFTEAHGNLGITLADLGQLDDAMAQYQKALEIKPGYAEVHNNLGLVLQACGRVDEAVTHFRRALAIRDDFVEAHSNLGMALASRSQFDEAIAQYRKALKIKPDYVEALNNLGYALAGRGRFAEAITYYRQALAIKPDCAMAHRNLGNAFAAQGQMDDAVTHYQKAVDIQPDDAEAHYNLGDAFAARSRLDEAVAHYRKALDLATQHNNRPLADALRAKIALYEAGTPYRQTLSPSAPLPPKP